MDSKSATITVVQDEPLETRSRWTLAGQALNVARGEEFSWYFDNENLTAVLHSKIGELRGSRGANTVQKSSFRLGQMVSA